MFFVMCDEYHIYIYKFLKPISWQTGFYLRCIKSWNYVCGWIAYWVLHKQRITTKYLSIYTRLHFINFKKKSVYSTCSFLWYSFFLYSLIFLLFYCQVKIFLGIFGSPTDSNYSGSLCILVVLLIIFRRKKKICSLTFIQKHVYYWPHKHDMHFSPTNKKSLIRHDVQNYEIHLIRYLH